MSGLIDYFSRAVQTQANDRLTRTRDFVCHFRYFKTELRLPKHVETGTKS